MYDIICIICLILEIKYNGVIAIFIVFKIKTFVSIYSFSFLIKNVIATPVNEAVDVKFMPVKVAPDTVFSTQVATITFNRM